MERGLFPNQNIYESLEPISNFRERGEKPRMPGLLTYSTHVLNRTSHRGCLQKTAASILTLPDTNSHSFHTCLRPTPASPGSSGRTTLACVRHSPLFS